MNYEPPWPMRAGLANSAGWLPGSLWMLGIAVELRILFLQVAAMNGNTPDDSFLRTAIAPWGWVAAGVGALLLVSSGIAARRVR